MNFLSAKKPMENPIWIIKKSTLLSILLYNFFSILYYTWIIHGPRLLQMRGVTHTAVVVHRKWVTTKQMQ